MQLYYQSDAAPTIWKSVVVFNMKSAFRPPLTPRQLLRDQQREFIISRQKWSTLGIELVRIRPCKLAATSSVLLWLRPE
jgi:hypothetical protein